MSDMDQRYEQVVEAVLRWMIEEGFRGYDPYDGCNTRYEFLRRQRSLRLLLTYANKFSPLNMRPLLGIEKSVNVYALALISTAILRGEPTRERREIARSNIREILSRSLVRKYGRHCWSGNGMFIQTTGTYHAPDVPGIIGTEAVGEALLAYERLHRGDPELRDVLLSVRDFCLKHLLQDRPEGVFFLYRPDTPRHVLTFNASMKAATLVTAVNRRYGSDVGGDMVRRSIQYLLTFQNPDGSWNYSVNLRTGRQKRQIDFHQGFILDGLHAYLEAYGSDSDVEAAFDRGLAFYRDRQFLANGQSYYRHPRKWPTNIHNQAQGIITFARVERRHPGSLAFARTIAEWTLENMYDVRGRFYYMKYPGFSNRIPYLRWNQAWMLYALSLLMHAEDAGVTAPSRAAPVAG